MLLFKFEMDHFDIRNLLDEQFDEKNTFLEINEVLFTIVRDFARLF